MKLFIDTETFSPTSISVGTYNYVSATELMVVSWAVDDGAVGVWDSTSGDPMDRVDEFDHALAHAEEVWSHNAGFDRLVIAKHFPDEAPALSRWRCTMALALAHSLPGGLDELGEVMGLPQDMRKIKDGKDLVRLFCMPRPKNHKLRRATRETHPAEWERFLEYAANDIVAMRELHRLLPKWNYRDAELRLWHLDQQINDRGFAVDVELARAAIATSEEEKARLAGRCNELTDGEVGAATQRDAMLLHILESYGIDLPDLQAATVDKYLLSADVPDALRELLSTRLQATTTSVAKYKKLLAAVSPDGRLRGTAQFCGASRTGRWAHRLFQPGNMPRATMPAGEIDIAVEAVKAGVAGFVW